MLVSEKMLIVEKKREGSILTLCNYERYANQTESEEAPIKRQRSADKAPIKRIEEGEEGIELELPLTPKGGLYGLEESMMPPNASRLSQTRKGQIKVKGNTPIMNRIGSFLNRRESNIWTVEELESLLAVKPPIEEIEGLEIYYTSPATRERDNRRTSLITLLNNWNTTELDRARAFINSQP